MRVRSILLALSSLVVVLPSRSLFAQDEFASGRFETSDGIELHYLEAGSGPLLVFVPGWTMPAEIWENQIRHFSRSHHVVAVDPRGQGRSDKPPFGYDPARRARDLDELLDHLDDGPAVLVGWSIGVRDVLLYTRDFGTGAVRGAVLVDNPIAREADGLAEGLAPIISGLQKDRETYTRDFVRSMFHSRQTDEYFDQLGRAAMATPTNAAAMMLLDVLMIGPPDLSPVLDALDRPAILVYSSDDWTREAVDRAHERWPNVRVETIDDAGHALFVDQPVEFNGVLEEFLLAVER